MVYRQNLSSVAALKGRMSMLAVTITYKFTVFHNYCAGLITSY
jgi:hypothetical protein